MGTQKSFTRFVAGAILTASAFGVFAPQALAQESIEEKVVFEFTPITLQARQDVGATKLVEIQKKNTSVVQESLQKQAVQQASETAQSATASGGQEDLSYRVRAALERANSILEQREEATKNTTVVLPPDLSNAGVAENLTTVVDNMIASSGSTGKTLADLQLSHDGSLAAKIVESALSQIGVQYVWGGESLAEGGFDCSGLMQWAYGQHGVSLSRTTYTQINEGVSVSLSEAQPGDLVFYNNTGHVAMYIGDGKVVHAPYTGTTITVDSVSMMPIESIKRIL